MSYSDITFSSPILNNRLICGFALSSSDSDDSSDESSLEAQPYLMEKVELGESSLFELSREHQFRVKVCSYVTGDVCVVSLMFDLF